MELAAVPSLLRDLDDLAMVPPALFLADHWACIKRRTV